MFTFYFLLPYFFTKFLSSFTHDPCFRHRKHITSRGRIVDRQRIKKMKTGLWSDSKKPKVLQNEYEQNALAAAYDEITKNKQRTMITSATTKKRTELHTFKQRSLPSEFPLIPEAPIIQHHHVCITMYQFPAVTRCSYSPSLDTLDSHFGLSDAPQ